MPRISRRLRDFKGSAESGVILALLGIRFNQMKLPEPSSGTEWRRSAWLAPFGGKQVAAPKKPGQGPYKAIEAAPGRYVKEKAA